MVYLNLIRADQEAQHQVGAGRRDGRVGHALPETATDRHVSMIKRRGW